MKILPVSSIVVSPDRQRRTFDAKTLMDLAESIRTKGLMHPIVVRQVNDEVHLVAGERRLRAISSFSILGTKYSCDGQTIDCKHIPVSFLTDLDALSVEEAELEENIIREDLPWQERAAAEARLHDLRTRQALAVGKTPPTFAEFTLDLGLQPTLQSAVRQDIIVARHLSNPEVAAAKSASDAYKIITKQEQKRVEAATAAFIGKTFSSRDHTLLNQDFLLFSQEIPDETFDIILTDPPYGMGADTFGDASGSLVSYTHDYSDDWDSVRKLFDAFGPESFRITKSSAHLYVFCDIDRFFYLRDWFSACGWQVHRTPIIWHKPKSHRVPWPNYGPRRHWEMVLYAVKGKKPTRHISADVISCDLDPSLNHAAQKPVGLLQDLLDRSGSAGAKVLDPFCGTGSTIVAAHNLKMACTGVELSPTAYAIAAKRIEELK